MTEPQEEFVYTPTPVQEDESTLLVREMNKKYALLRGGTKPVYLIEENEPVQDTDYNRKTYTLTTQTWLKTYFANTRILNPHSTRYISHFTCWLEHPERRTYEKGITFQPDNRETPGYLNLWRGFDIQPKQGNWDLIKNHLREVISNNNDKIFEYLIRYLAHLFQKPGERKPGVAICMRGEPGTGKGIFLQILRRIIGPQHFMSISNQGQITGKFNDHLKDLLVLFVDESFWSSSSKSQEGILKNLVTEPEIAVEGKFKSVVSLPSYLRVFLASNQDWIAPVSPGERRFFTIDVSNKYKGNKEYFDKLGAEINGDGAAAMLYALSKIDNSKFNFLSFPFTDTMWEQHLHGMDTVESFWYKTLCDGFFIRHDKKRETISALEENKIYVNILYHGYKEHCKKIKKKWVSSIIFGRKLIQNFLGDSIYRKDNNSPKRHVFDNLTALREGYLAYVGPYGHHIFEM